MAAVRWAPAVAAKSLAAIAAVLALTGCGSSSPAGPDRASQSPPEHERVASDGKRPNIVVVMSDDQDAASFEQAMPRTARLARTGTTFTDYVITTPSCCPSRASFITGEYGHNNGVLANIPGYPDLLQKENVLPAWLQRAGYRTAEFGKFMNGYENFASAMGALRSPGWDEWEALLPPYRYFDYDLSVNNVRRHFGTGDRDYLDSVLTRRTLRFIRAHWSSGRPYFAWLNLHAPHLVGPGLEPRAGGCRGGAVPAPGDEGRFRAATVPVPRSFGERDVSDKPYFVRTQPPIDARRAAQARRWLACRLASLVEADRSVARIHETLRATGQLGRTVLVFTSDNGWLEGEHRLRGKAVPYEEAVRVPLVVWAPPGVVGRQPPRRIDQATANIDLAPTLLRIASGRPCRNEHRCRVMDGRSLLPLLDGRSGAWPSDRAILLESREGDHGICRFQAVRTTRRVYAEYSRFARRGGDECARPTARELYDLRSDPSELRNLLTARPESRAARIQAGLKARLDRLRDCRGLAGRDHPSPGHPLCR
jgi:arylsulfatase A-like enzyme